MIKTKKRKQNNVGKCISLWKQTTKYDLFIYTEAKCKEKPILYPCGNLRRDTLSKKLKEAGIETCFFIVSSFTPISTLFWSYHISQSTYTAHMDS